MAESSGFHPGVRGFDSRSRHLASSLAVSQLATSFLGSGLANG